MLVIYEKFFMEDKKIMDKDKSFTNTGAEHLCNSLMPDELKLWDDILDKVSPDIAKKLICTRFTTEQYKILQQAVQSLHSTRVLSLMNPDIEAWRMEQILIAYKDGLSNDDVSTLYDRRIVSVAKLIEKRLTLTNTMYIDRLSDKLSKFLGDGNDLNDQKNWIKGWLERKFSLDDMRLFLCIFDELNCHPTKEWVERLIMKDFSSEQLHVLLTACYAGISSPRLMYLAYIHFSQSHMQQIILAYQQGFSDKEVAFLYTEGCSLEAFTAARENMYFAKLTHKITTNLARLAQKPN